MDTPRLTRMQVTLDDLTMFDEWLAGRHDSLLRSLDTASTSMPTTSDGVAPTTIDLLADLQDTRRMQRKVAEARERCNSPAPERGEVDEPDAEAS